MRVHALLMVIIAGCATHHKGEWRMNDAGPFTFLLPADMRKTSEHGIDSYVAEFEGSGLTVSFDYGPDPEESRDYYKDRPGYATHTERIGGHDVQIISFESPPGGQRFDHSILALYASTELTMIASCKSTSDYDTATEVFRSVRFKKP